MRWLAYGKVYVSLTRKLAPEQHILRGSGPSCFSYKKIATYLVWWKDKESTCLSLVKTRCEGLYKYDKKCHLYFQTSIISLSHSLFLQHGHGAEEDEDRGRGAKRQRHALKHRLHKPP